MNYQETLEYLFKQLPMFQRIGATAYKANLNNTIALDNYFGNPHKKFKTIHIAGTNGKGSVTHSIASVLQEAGYKTGLYTSPHYLDFRERIKINGEPVSKEYVVAFVEKHSNFFMSLKPSFFEITVAMAFDYFAKEQIDVAVIEVGMGGRLDSTNIITPVLSVITNISYDHTQFLGNKLTEIASEKAGIIKKDIPVVTGETKTEVKQVFSKKAQQVDAPVFFVDNNYNVKNFYLSEQNTLVFNIEKHGNTLFESIEFGLIGEYQKFNIAVILQSVEILKNIFDINEKQLKEGLINVVKNTGIMGRWQTLNDNPKVICDAGHNIDGIHNVTNQIKNLQFEKLHFVIGFVKDKDINGILKILPQNALYYFTKANLLRALNEKELKKQAETHNLYGDDYISVETAILNALKNATDNDLIFIGGSTFIVAEAIDFFRKYKKS